MPLGIVSVASSGGTACFRHRWLDVAHPPFRPEARARVSVHIPPCPAARPRHAAPVLVVLCRRQAERPHRPRRRAPDAAQPVRGTTAADYPPRGNPAADPPRGTVWPPRPGRPVPSAGSPPRQAPPADSRSRSACPRHGGHPSPGPRRGSVRPATRPARRLPLPRRPRRRGREAAQPVHGTSAPIRDTTGRRYVDVTGEPDTVRSAPRAGRMGQWQTPPLPCCG